MGDALVACVVCQKRTYLHAALDRVGEDAGAPMCDACWAQAHVQPACIQGRVSPRQARSRRGAVDGEGTDDESFIIAIVRVSSCVAGGPTIESGRFEDCPWCGFAEGTVEDCHCGLRVCRVCVDQEEGLCVCGHDFNETLSD